MDLGDRMKAYEKVTDLTLTRRMPMILRLDGRAFHTWTRQGPWVQPFDSTLRQLFSHTAERLISAMDGVAFVYGQSDEVSFLLQDWYGLDTTPWFGKRLQKIVSVAASLFTAHFNQAVGATLESWPSHALRNPVLVSRDYVPLATFDARAFVLPFEEVANYFLWRQRDATRNSIQGLAHAYCSQEAIHGLHSNQLQEKLWQDHQINWNDLPAWQKRGWVLHPHQDRWLTDLCPPIFSQDPTYLTRFLTPQVPA